MSLEKNVVTDQIEITRDGSVQVRGAVLFIENGIELAKTYHRHVLHPGDDLTGQDERVIAVAQAVWTPEVIAAYQESLPPPIPPGDDEDPGEQ